MREDMLVRTDIPRRPQQYVVRLVLMTTLTVVSPLLVYESVTFPSASHQAGPVAQLSGYLYCPDGPGPFPAVVTLHGCSGLLMRGGKIGANARFWAEHFRGRRAN